MDKVIEYIYDIPKFSRKTSLTNTCELLRRIGFNEEKYRIIHVAGTNGKGSVCAYLSEILRLEGKSTGRFISPHLVRINERISVDGEEISDNEFKDSFQKIQSLSVRMVQDGYQHPSFFEFLFGMAMDYFQSRGVEYIILETGLGGRLDATNVFLKPIVTIITSIGLDHTDILGNTYSRIAYEKSGIIKPGVPVVYERKRSDVTSVISTAAADNGAEEIYFYPDDIKEIKVNDKNIDFCLHNKYYDNVYFTVNSRGIYQTENAVLAILAAGIVLNIPLDAIKTGIARTEWTCRMQKLLNGMVVDGAHNEDGIKRFLESVSYDGCTGKRLLLFCAVKDKHYEKMASLICESGLFDCIVTGVLKDKRGIDNAELTRIFPGNGQYSVFNCLSVPEAFDKIEELAGNNDSVYAAGSLYLAGEILDMTKEL